MAHDSCVSETDLALAMEKSGRETDRLVGLIRDDLRDGFVKLESKQAPMWAEIRKNGRKVDGILEDAKEEAQSKRDTAKIPVSKPDGVWKYAILGALGGSLMIALVAWPGVFTGALATVATVATAAAKWKGP